MTKWELSFQQGRSVLRVSNPSHETHGKTKLHIPMKKKEKDEGGRGGGSPVQCAGWEQDRDNVQRQVGSKKRLRNQ